MRTQKPRLGMALNRKVSARFLGGGVSALTCQKSNPMNRSGTAAVGREKMRKGTPRSTRHFKHSMHGQAEGGWGRWRPRDGECGEDGECAVLLACPPSIRQLSFATGGLRVVETVRRVGSWARRA